MKKWIKRMSMSHSLPRWIILIIDLLTVVLSCFLAYSLRYGAAAFSNYFTSVLLFSLGIVMIAAFFFFLFKTYAGVLRYSSFVDILRIVVSLILVYFLAVIAIALLKKMILITVGWWSVCFIAMVINISMMSCGRIFIKVLADVLGRSPKNSKNVLVYGARDAGVAIAKSIRLTKGYPYKLCGFIVDEPDLVGKMILGEKVYRNNEDLINFITDESIDLIIVSPSKMEDLKNSDKIDMLLSFHVRLLVAPPLNEWEGNVLDTNDLKNIKIEELLERPSIVISKEDIITHLEGKRVLITGAAGSIGSEIVRQVASFNPYQLILVDQAETPLHDMRLELHDNWSEINSETIVADIQNKSRLDAIFQKYKPQYVFHTAAYKHVPMMEDNVSESIQTNVMGTRNIADLAVKYKTEKFVMISTDKAVNPTNIMGCSKRLAEIYVQSLAKKLMAEGNNATQFITTRFGNVLGSNGSVIPRFKEQIEKGGPVTVTHPDIIRYFMTIPEACNLVLEAGSMGNNGEIYIFDMGKPVKILDLARKMINLSGKKNIKIEFTGLRHGEKLYEELLNVKETTKPTHHEKIMVAKVREYDYDVIKELIQELIDISYQLEPMKIVSKMKEIVPEFISKNSPFSVLDKITEKQNEAL